MEHPGWTLDELAAQVAAVLADGGADQPSRRVRSVPDRRAIRWYTTIGLLDRPRLRGRTGWYGRRHLLQLVAIKRLQAAGSPLAEIQGQLAGADDATLRRIARLTDEQLQAAPAPGPAPRSRRARFWSPAAAEPADVAAAPAPAKETARVRYALDLGDGVTLLLDGAPRPEDLPAVRAAAQPLLDLLNRRGPTRAVPDEEAEGESP